MPYDKIIGWWSTPAAWWKDCWSERILRAAGVTRERPRPRSRRPTGSWRWSTIPTATRRRSGGRFKEITEAYEVLRDPQKRAAYDRFGKAGVAGAGGFDYPPCRSLEALNIFMRDFGGWGASSRSSAAGAGGRTTGGAGCAGDRQARLSDVAAASRNRSGSRRWSAAPTCNGSGAKAGTKPPPAPPAAARARSVGPPGACSASSCRSRLSDLRRRGHGDRDPCEVCRGEGGFGASAPSRWTSRPASPPTTT
jgi:DnaJ-class molecular chaperone